ncbi:MAG: PRC-barrel domain-containing protein [bacterium]|nr:PRC-barrel domain-containing protein [bacterium]
MLRSLKDLENYDLLATDGEIGTVVNFLLDDESWTVRYLVAEANGFSGGRDVLISPISFKAAEWDTRCFRLNLTREKVRNSPGIDTDLPVSRQHEIDYHRYFGFPVYWGGSSIWGLGTYPACLRRVGGMKAVAANAGRQDR